MRTSIALALAAAKLIAAHSTFQSIVVNGKDQGQHFAVQTPSNYNNPIYDVTSSPLICNGGTATTDFVKVAAGSKIGLQWHHNDPMTTSGDSDEPIASSHKGPVMVYIAKATKGNGEGAVWTKIQEEGLSGDKWEVDTFIANKGLIEVTLPDLEDGEYLIRPEIIALHEASGEAKAQFYNGCGQLKITGGSTALPTTGTDMTKAYSATDPGVLVNIYNGITKYEIPGPAVWDGASSGATPATPTTSATPSATSASATSSIPSATATPTASVTPLPEKFTVEEFTTYVKTATEAEGRPRRHVRFISWLREQTGVSTKVRRHARAFDV